MLRLASGVCTVERFCLVFHSNPRRASTDRTDLRNILHTASRKVLRDLGDDHVGLINLDLVTDPKLQLLHDTDVVHTCPAHCRSLQLHRFKDCHRIDQPGSRRTPFDLQKRRLPDLVRPLKCKRISREFRRCPQRFSVGDIVVHKHKSI